MEYPEKAVFSGVAAVAAKKPKWLSNSRIRSSTSGDILEFSYENYDGEENIHNDLFLLY